MAIALTLRIFLQAIMVVALCMATNIVYSQQDSSWVTETKPGAPPKKVFYGLASFYHNKFHGRKTASGDIFSQDKMTAACNVLPLGTTIKVTNLRNGRSVIVKTTDRLHPRMRRLVDLSRIAAQKLGYISQGLTRVKVEVVSPK